MAGSCEGSRQNVLSSFTFFLNLYYAYVVRAKSFQSCPCPTVCRPMDCSPPGTSVHGILQARILEQVAMPSSSRSSRPRDQTCVSWSPALAGGFFTASATWPCALSISVHIWRAALARVEGLNVLMIGTLRTMSCITKCFKIGFAINLKKSESHSVVSDSVTPWNTQSVESSRPEYWSGQPFPSPGDLPNPGMEPRFPASQVDSLPAEPQGKPINLKVTQC